MKYTYSGFTGEVYGPDGKVWDYSLQQLVTRLNALTDEVKAWREVESAVMFLAPQSKLDAVRDARLATDATGAMGGWEITRHYYNDNDRGAVATLKNLVAAGRLPPGDVDDRSIADVQPSELDGYTQCHFFAGAGGWPLALQLAGVSPDRPLWTGSCPCQPFSSAGKRKGKDDERHLWPEFMRLIRGCRPDAVLGEQVAGAIAHGWADGVSADLEAEGYAFRFAVLGAHSVGAPHKRQRMYWVADSAGARCNGALADTKGETRDETRMRVSCAGCQHDTVADARRERDERRGIAGVVAETGGRAESQAWQRQRCGDATGDSGAVDTLAHPQHQPAGAGVAGIEGRARVGRDRTANDGGVDTVGDGQSVGRDERRAESGRPGSVDAAGASVALGDGQCEGLEGHRRHGDDGDQPGRERTDTAGSTAEAGGDGAMADAAANVGDIRLDQQERRQEGRGVDWGDSPWSAFTVILCRDGKYRRVPAAQPGVRGLADGVPPGFPPACPDLYPLATGQTARAAKLKLMGNAIVPQVAAAFIRATLTPATAGRSEE